MQNEINLLKTDKKVRVKKSSFFKLCLSILIIIVFVTAGEFLYAVYLKTRLAGIKSDQSATLKQIVSIDAKRVKFQTLNERLDAISKILPLRKIFQERVEVVTKNIPAQATVEAFDIDKNTIAIRVYSPRLDVINNFLETGLLNISNQKIQPVSRVIITSVGTSKSPAGYLTLATIVF